jgi:hypothetical protein
MQTEQDAGGWPVGDIEPASPRIEQGQRQPETPASVFDVHAATKSQQAGEYQCHPTVNQLR